VEQWRSYRSRVRAGHVLHAKGSRLEVAGTDVCEWKNHVQATVLHIYKVHAEVNMSQLLAHITRKGQ
jgi:hypothetical protein